MIKKVKNQNKSCQPPSSPLANVTVGDEGPHCARSSRQLTHTGAGRRTRAGAGGRHGGCPGPLVPPEEEEGARQPRGWWRRCRWEPHRPLTGACTRSAAGGSSQLGSYGSAADFVRSEVTTLPVLNRGPSPFCHEEFSCQTVNRTSGQLRH